MDEKHILMATKQKLESEFARMGFDGSWEKLEVNYDEWKEFWNKMF